MRRKSIFLAALAFALVLGMGITPAGAYFTDQSTANGGLPIIVKPDTEIYEWASGTHKTIVIKNADNAAPAFVRVKVETAADVTIVGEGWDGPQEGGWYVYKSELPAGGETKNLEVDIDFGRITTIEPITSLKPAQRYTCNVSVIYEQADAKYNADGTPDYGDWHTTRDEEKPARG